MDFSGEKENDCVLESNELLNQHILETMDFHLCEIINVLILKSNINWGIFRCYFYDSKPYRVIAGFRR